jgi:hypothetical protein
MEDVLGLARLPITPPNLVKRGNEQQEGLIKVMGVIDVFFDDWIVGNLIGRDPLLHVYREGGLIPIENKSKMHPLSFPRQ